MFSPLSHPSSAGPARPRRAQAARPATIDLELQSACKFGLAILLGFGAVVATGPILGAAAIVIIALTMAGRSLLVLGQNPSAPRLVRPRSHAAWDGTLAVCLAVVAMILALFAAPLAAATAGIGAVALAALRLRTRYVAF